MFQRLRLWLTGASGLKEATREAARDATREGLLEGIRLGVDDALAELSGLVEQPEPVLVESNGQLAVEPITAAEIRGLRKPDLLVLAGERGIDADESWTVAQLRDTLTAPQPV